VFSLFVRVRRAACKKSALFAACLVCFGFVGCLAAVAQTAGTGALSGTVTDPTGAVVAGAEVKAIDQSTGEARTAVSGSDGTYTLPLLPPGAYRIEAGKTGFKTTIRPGLNVNVTETTRFDIQLQLGAVSQNVTVEANAALVQTDSSALGRVVGEESINQLPLVTRNYTQIIGLSPGVSQSVTNAAALGRGNGGESTETEGQGLFVHGGRGYDNNFQMDGVPINDREGSGGESGGIAIPNPDNIQEFKVQTGQYDASFGPGAGANVDIVTKSGSNQFHGSAFEFFRNEALNANDFFLNEAGQKRPVMRQNQFGGDLGGPIKKDKLFFFGSYQGTRQLNGLAEATTAATTGSVGGCRVSTSSPALTNDRSAAALGALFGGRSGVAGGETVNPSGSNINPISLRLLQMKLPNGSYLIPTPQVITGNASNPDAAGLSVFSTPCPFSEDQFMTNFDYLQNTRSTFKARFFFANSGSTVAFPQSSNIPGFPRDTDNQFRNLSLSHSYVFTPNLLNQAYFGYHRTVDALLATSPFSWSSLGVNAAPQNNNLPCIVIAGSDNICSAYSSIFYQNVFAFTDSLSYTLGRHSFRFGGGVTRSQGDFLDYTNNDTVVFLSWPDFLLATDGVTNGSGVSNVFESARVNGLFDRAFRIWDANLYAQDDFKVSRRFTANLGIRYDFMGGYSDALGRFANFNYGLANLNAPPTGTLAGFVAAANWSGGPLPPGVVRSPNDSAINNDGENNFGPRVGFAWQVLPHSDRFVVRGGYGIYYSPVTGQSTFVQLAFTAPFSNIGVNLGQFNPTTTFANPFAQPIPSLNSFPLWPPYSSTSSNAVTTIAPNFRPSITQEYSFETQTSLARNFLLEIGYVGTRGTHVFRGVALNQAELASPSNPIRGQTTNTLANLPLRTPILGFSPGSLDQIESEGAFWYNALEASLTKRISRGLQFLASYTFDKELSTDGANAVVVSNSATTVGNQDDPKSRYGRPSFDRAQRLIVSYVYEFPNRTHGNAFVTTALSGWSISGVITYQSGLALTLLYTNPFNVYGISNDRAYIAPGCNAGQLVTPGPAGSKLNNYFNTSCVTTPPVIGAEEPASSGCPKLLPDGNCPAIATNFGDSGVGDIDGPVQRNWDISMAKRTPLRGPSEAANLEFRAEFFNAFNTPQFANPDANLADSSFGRILSTSVNPRLIQFALKLNF